jgi:hypothetical protein
LNPDPDKQFVCHVVRLAVVYKSAE